MPKYKGGFSAEVFYSKTFQDYIKDAKENERKYGSPLLFGYIGNCGRSMIRDQIVEEELRKHTTDPESIAGWLTSKDGRYFMDGINSRTTGSEFRKAIKEYLKKNPIEKEKEG